MKNKNKIAWFRSTLVALGLMLLAVESSVGIGLQFMILGELAFFLPYLLSFMGIAFALTLILKIYHRYVNTQKLSFAIKDMMTGVKFAIVTLASTSGLSVFCVTSMLWFEKLDQMPVVSSLEAVVEGDSYVSYLVTLVLFVTVYVVTGPMFAYFGFAGAQLIHALANALVDVMPALYYLISPLTGLPMWLAGFAILMSGVYLSGGNWSNVWNISATKKPTSKSKKNPFRRMLIAFLWGSPFLLLFPLFVLATAPEILSVLSIDIMFYIIANIVLYAIQPMVEEMMFRSFLYKYMASEGLVSDDYRDMNMHERVLYALLNAWMFVMVHQAVRGYASLLDALYYLPGSFFLAYLPFLTGRIDLSTYEHSFHNLCCSIAPWFMAVSIGFWELGVSEVFMLIPEISSAATKMTALVTMFSKDGEAKKPAVPSNKASNLVFSEKEDSSVLPGLMPTAA